VPRFYDTTEGRVLVDGVDVRRLVRRSLRSEIGVISQDPFLFSASIRDNIALGMPDAPFAAVEAARRRPGSRLHPRAATRLRHRCRRARDHALGRPAAAHRDRAGTSHRPADPRPRRRDRVRRRHTEAKIAQASAR
jgi:hypothetical protein